MGGAFCLKAGDTCRVEIGLGLVLWRIGAEKDANRRPDDVDGANDVSRFGPLESGGPQTSRWSLDLLTCLLGIYFILFFFFLRFSRMGQEEWHCRADYSTADLGFTHQRCSLEPLVPFPFVCYFYFNLFFFVVF